MRILQVTNIISPHQIPLAKQLAMIVGENNFRFAAMAPPDPERLRMGWQMADTESWILRPGECENDMHEYEHWWNEADVVLCGERLFQGMSQRLARGQLCFYMSERWWKPNLGRARLLSPKFFKLALEFRRISNNPNFHYLPIGPLATQDIFTLKKFNDRIWNWGYFTDLPQQITIFAPSRKILKVLWVGRMLDWKNVDILIKSIKKISTPNNPFELTLVGNGPERPYLERLANENINGDTITFIDPLPSSKIIDLMRQFDVYVLPSSAYEGWGAVINEAMSAGLAVISSDQTGSAAAMIDHGINGLLFESGNQSDLECCLLRLSEDEKFRNILASRAMKTIYELWSPQVAAKRLLEFSQSIISKQKPKIYSSGPLSNAININRKNK